MKFGKQETTEVVDDKTTITTENRYWDGKLAKPIRKRYEIRLQSEGDPLILMNEILERQLNSLDRLEREIRIDKRKDKDGKEYVHLIECYTIIEY